MAFIHEDFLLSNATARRLFHKYAEPQCILDYHCHLPPKDVAENRRFGNLFEIWLEGDHYKWRAMRSNGCEERLCTGDAAPYEKFLAWAGTVPNTLRNPLYHWTHLELKRYFGIDELLDESTARRIWNTANELLAGEDLRAQAILKKFHVKALCTTDDPIDDLAWHAMIARLRPGDARLPDVPAGQGAHRAPARGVQPVGGPAGRGLRHGDFEFPVAARRLEAPARLLSRDGRAPLRPRAEPVLRRFLPAERGRRGSSTARGRARPPQPRSSASSPPS